MSEVRRLNEIPIPLANYIDLIKNGKSPYYDVVKHLLKEMEIHYTRMGDRSEVVYTINPRILEKELREKIQNPKLTKVNVCRSILAFFYGSKLEEGEDFFISTTSGGRKNYHIKINEKTFPKLKNFLYSSPGIF